MYVYHAHICTIYIYLYVYIYIYIYVYPYVDVCKYIHNFMKYDIDCCGDYNIIFFFPYIGNNHFEYVSKGLKPPTRYGTAS